MEAIKKTKTETQGNKIKNSEKNELKPVELVGPTLNVLKTVSLIIFVSSIVLLAHTFFVHGIVTLTLAAITALAFLAWVGFSVWEYKKEGRHRGTTRERITILEHAIFGETYHVGNK